MYPVKTLVLVEPLPLTSLVTDGQVSSRFWPQQFPSMQDGMWGVDRILEKL